MGCLMIVVLLLGLAMPVRGQTASPRSMQLGVDADNWSGQIQSSAYENGLRLMKIDFISWHIQPEEEASPDRLQAMSNSAGKTIGIIYSIRKWLITEGATRSSGIGTVPTVMTWRSGHWRN